MYCPGISIAADPPPYSPPTPSLPAAKAHAAAAASAAVLAADAEEEVEALFASAACSRSPRARYRGSHEPGHSYG